MSYSCWAANLRFLSCCFNSISCICQFRRDNWCTSLTVFGSFVGYWLMNWCGREPSLSTSTDATRMADFLTTTVVLVQMNSFEEFSAFSLHASTEWSQTNWASRASTTSTTWVENNREPSQLIVFRGRLKDIMLESSRKTFVDNKSYLDWQAEEAEGLFHRLVSLEDSSHVDWYCAVEERVPSWSHMCRNSKAVYCVLKRLEAKLGSSLYLYLHPIRLWVAIPSLHHQIACKVVKSSFEVWLTVYPNHSSNSGSKQASKLQSPHTKSKQSTYSYSS